MTRAATAVLALATALGVACAPGSARADELPTTELNAEARAQYNQGTEALTSHRYVEAALHFETATSKYPHAVSWYMAAEAWERASRPERAADALSRALDVPGLSVPLGEKIVARLRTLEASLGTVVFGGAPSYRAAVDGSTSISPPARLHGLPGTHVVTIIPPDRRPFRREVSLTAGAELTMTLGEPEDEEPKSPSPTEKVTTVERIVEREVPRPAEPRKYVGFGVIGLGTASLAAGLVLGLNALDAKDAYGSSRTQEAYDHVRTVQAWSNVALVTGGVLAIAGVTLVVWPTEARAHGAGARSATLSAGPTGALLRGSF